MTSTVHDCGFSAPETRVTPDGVAHAPPENETTVKGTLKPRRGRILLAYDGTPSARRALQRAATIHRAGDEVAVIHVIEGADDDDGLLAEARYLLQERGIESTPIKARGNPARSICVAAERDGYDTIVVGRRNFGDRGLLLLGSVAARVVSGAACDVVVVA
jgi:nucleotide-binding universal stress UspA family protein